MTALKTMLENIEPAGGTPLDKCIAAVGRHAKQEMEAIGDQDMNAYLVVVTDGVPTDALNTPSKV